MGITPALQSVGGARRRSLNDRRLRADGCEDEAKRLDSPFNLVSFPSFLAEKNRWVENRKMFLNVSPYRGQRGWALTATIERQMGVKYCPAGGTCKPPRFTGKKMSGMVRKGEHVWMKRSEIFSRAGIYRDKRYMRISSLSSYFLQPTFTCHLQIHLNPEHPGAFVFLALQLFFEGCFIATSSGGSTLLCHHLPALDWNRLNEHNDSLIR